jgi:hypothetical protein
MRRAAIVACLLGLAGCFSPPSAGQRLSDAAVDMNAATRFGRMDIAIEHVGAAARAEFARRHAAWGGNVRVVDLEMGGFDLVQRDEAEVLVNVAWQRPDESTVRVTRIAQRWRDEQGRWKLVDEERKDGDTGLLGDQAPQAGKTAPHGAASVAPPPQRLGLQRRVIREE